ncbi:acetyl-CoA acetyltransferase [Paenibacillus ginsengarvi]|uniref:Acetyl-CoA acetyltransferase n=1 Tax=Paenibacillus ginsengarvi TaxID=400777 RepID=A0A3B0AZI0_9BACL|nr:acetyl-CoA acetyltransferase [Paenibacillus ginsengarvi]RKN65446.1 acetyl-CoA acetyltransferase [Paenibacillus ginsengarvi]
MSSGSIPAQQPVYQADPHFIQAMKSCHDRLHEVGRQWANRPVRVQLMDGQVHEGVLVSMDDHYLYLGVRAQDARAFFNPLAQASAYNNVILPLVLYNLLVISLL